MNRDCAKFKLCLSKLRAFLELAEISSAINRQNATKILTSVRSIAIASARHAERDILPSIWNGCNE